MLIEVAPEEDAETGTDALTVGASEAAQLTVGKRLQDAAVPNEAVAEPEADAVTAVDATVRTDADE